MKENKLQYSSPAKDWNEALPLGNGKLGMMVFGGVGDKLMTDLSAMKHNIDIAFDFVRSRLFFEKTGLIYDHVIVGREKDFPTSEECANVFPNPCGYSTGMEDGMINGATMLDACLLRYDTEHDPIAADFAKQLVFGMLNCASAAASEGFLPRAVSPEDGKSHYPDSSRDQYTMFAFGMHRFLNSPLCQTDIKKKIADTATSIARRAERNVTPSTSYDMLDDNGKATLVTTLWGENLGNHEYLRLPMLYLLAFESSGDTYWLERYLDLREKAYQKSLPMGDYWALYTLQQMQASARLCYDVDPEPEWKEKYLLLMHTVADYAENKASAVWQKITKIKNCNLKQAPFRDLEMTHRDNIHSANYPYNLHPKRPDGTDFFTLQDGAQISIIKGLAPGRKPKEDTSLLLSQAFERIDLNIHELNLPLYFIDGYYRSI